MTAPIKGCPQPDPPELVMRADGYHYQSEDEMKDTQRELTDEQIEHIAATEIPSWFTDSKVKRFARAAIAADRALNIPADRDVMRQAVTEEMVAAYLTANDKYWRETDAQPHSNPSKWRNGTPSEATRVSLEAALAAAPTPPAEQQGVASKLLHRAMEQLYAWSKKYGEHQPAWLPPAGDVTLCEDIAEYIARRSVPAPQGVAEVMELVDDYSGAVAETVAFNITQRSSGPIRMALPRLKTLEQAITALFTERDTLRARMVEVEKDAARIDWLEAQINENGALHLHDGNDAYGLGLGLRTGRSTRSLRKAIDDASKETK